MSIVWSWAPDDKADYRPADIDSKDRACFLCHRLLEPPIVHWMGSTSDIYLHADCVLMLASRMLRDVEEIVRGGVAITEATEIITKRWMQEAP